MWYCMSLMLHLSTTFHHVSTIHVYIWFCIVRYFTTMQHHIVDIVHIDENMTRLIDFHGLGSTFSDRMRTKGFAIYSTHNSRTGKVSIFWSTSKTSQMFSKSQQKRQVLGDLRVYRVWPCGNLWSVLPFCTVSSQPQLDERGLYVWFALMCKTSAVSWRRGYRTIGHLERNLDF